MIELFHSKVCLKACDDNNMCPACIHNQAMANTLEKIYTFVSDFLPANSMKKDMSFAENISMLLAELQQLRLDRMIASVSSQQHVRKGILDIDHESQLSDNVKDMIEKFNKYAEEQADARIKEEFKDKSNE